MCIVRRRDLASSSRIRRTIGRLPGERIPPKRHVHATLRRKCRFAVGYPVPGDDWRSKKSNRKNDTTGCPPCTHSEAIRDKHRKRENRDKGPENSAIEKRKSKPPSGAHRCSSSVIMHLVPARQFQKSCSKTCHENRIAEHNSGEHDLGGIEGGHQAGPTAGTRLDAIGQSRYRDAGARVDCELANDRCPERSRTKH